MRRRRPRHGAGNETLAHPHDSFGTATRSMQIWPLGQQIVLRSTCAPTRTAAAPVQNVREASSVRKDIIRLRVEISPGLRQTVLLPVAPAPAEGTPDRQLGRGALAAKLHWLTVEWLPKCTPDGRLTKPDNSTAGFRFTGHFGSSDRPSQAPSDAP